MDASLKQDAARISPEIPFNPSTKHTHSTWARTFHSRPELYFQPSSEDAVRKILSLARRHRKRIVVVGSGHSPSTLTCTSSWLINLDKYGRLLSIDSNGLAKMQAGIRLRDLRRELEKDGFNLPNLGSIDEQSIAGAIATGTHGSSLKHGTLSENVRRIKLMLSSGEVVQCSKEENQDLFRAALVSLGALGVVIEVEFQATRDFKIEWEQKLVPLNEVLSTWDRDLWTKTEFTRVWWMPYMKTCIRWRASKTDKDIRRPRKSWFDSKFGFHLYQALLAVSNWFPSILPWMERFVIRVQYGSSIASGVEYGAKGLLMNCLFSQFVNEWAIPLEKGPEALTRLSAWLHGDEKTARIPYSSKNLYVHAPIEVRVSDTSKANPRPYLDNTNADGPTLYLNATLYRPYLRDPPCHKRYYQAFEYLMKELGGKPHWAKNFSTLTASEAHSMYTHMDDYLRVRNRVDPEGMFIGQWHLDNLFVGANADMLPLAEREIRLEKARDGGQTFHGEILPKATSPQFSESSFDMLRQSEMEEKDVSVSFTRDSSGMWE